jgi:hypothetical protein
MPFPRAQAELTKKRLDRAGKLTSALGEEGVRWSAAADGLGEQAERLVGDVFLAAACIAYYGAFTGGWVGGWDGFPGGGGGYSWRRRWHCLPAAVTPPLTPLSSQHTLVSQFTPCSPPVPPPPRSLPPPSSGARPLPAGAYRRELVAGWVASCQEAGVPVSPELSLRNTLASPVEVRPGREGGGGGTRVGGHEYWGGNTCSHSWYLLG